VTTPLIAQSVVIKNATPAMVTKTAAEYLQPNGFVLVRSDSGGEELGLDRGKIPQENLFRTRRGIPTNLFWVVMEVHLRYKPKGQGLEVSVYEDAVVLEDDSSFVERRRVTTHVELDNLHVLLNDLRGQLDQRPASGIRASPRSHNGSPGGLTSA
jgi:hypothetical protein